MTAMSTTDTDKLTKLLFNLPAELRNKIYTNALPKIKPHVPLERANHQLQWLASSKRLFIDAAAMFYGSSCFYHGTRLPTSPSHMNIVGLFEKHIRNTYSNRIAQPALSVIAGQMIRELVLDLRMPYEQVQDLPSRLQSYFEGVATRFPNLKKLYIFFGPDFFTTDIGIVYMRNDFEKLRRKWMEPGEYAGGGYFDEAIAVVDDLVPEDCEISWKISSQFNSWRVKIGRPL